MSSNPTTKIDPIELSILCAHEIALKHCARCLRQHYISLTSELAAVRDALSRIKWTKDCGIDGRNEAGEFVNFASDERDHMYNIACAALAAKEQT